MAINIQEVDQLKSAVQELSILNDIATAISSVWELDQVVEMIVQKCVKHLKVEQGAVMLLDEEDTSNPFQTMVRQVDSQNEGIPFHFGVQLSGWMLKNEKPLLINNFQDDDRFQVGFDQKFPIRSLLSVPLKLKGQMIGLLNVFNKREKGGFTQEDQRLLSIIAAQSAQVIENARLYEEEKVLLRIEEDLRLAQEIQRNLLPKGNPVIPGYDVAGRSTPAKEVGGDYYDFISMEGSKIALALGDISGKGMPAALLMSNLQATLRGQTRFSSSSEQCLKRSNKLLYESTDVQKFATLFYSMLDYEKHEITYSKAGHDAPFYFKNTGEMRRLETGGTILGFREESDFEEETLIMEPGDLILVYSDGITEAMNSQRDEEFGEERLQKVIQKHLDKSSKQLMEQIFRAVRDFTEGTPQSDDMTLLAIQRMAG